MLFPDAKAVWLVRSRQLETRLNFWLFIIGVDRRKRTLNDNIYMVYAFVFFAIWGFLVLVLLAEQGANLARNFPRADPAWLVVLAQALIMAAWFLATLNAATRRSPLLFSEADAYLLCQTPVSRRTVGLLWLLTEWPFQGMLLWTVTIVLGYSRIELQASVPLTANDLPAYLAAGFRAFITVLPLQLGLFSLVWATGAYRLRRDEERPRLRLLVPVLVVCSVLLARMPQPFLSGFLLPLRAAFAAAPWQWGFSLALLFSLAGLLSFALASGSFSLCRAAQETRGLEARGKLALTGSSDVARDMALRERLGASHRPSRLPLHPGRAVMLWKDAVQWLRGAGIGEISSWLLLLGASLAAAAIPDWGTRTWAIFGWVLLVGQKAAAPMRQNLKLWWLFRQLPFAPTGIILAEVAPPGFAALALTAIPLFTGYPGSWPEKLLLSAFLPPVTLTVALAACYDVLRQCRVDKLLTGNVPGGTALGVLLGILGAAVPLAVVPWLMGNGWPLGAGALVALSAEVAVSYAFWVAVTGKLRNLG